MPWVAYRQAATGMLVPAYQYPTLGTFWAVCGAYAPPGSYVIANPASGPGISTDANYTAAIAAAKAAGLTVLGYVDTNYTAVPSGTVLANIATWNTLYPGVTSIFLDRADNSLANEGYYHTICDQVHTVASAVAVLNFGTIPVDTAYMGFADIAVVYEGDYMAGTWQTFLAGMPALLAAVPSVAAARFAAVVYNCPSPYFMQQVLAQSQAVNVGSVYVTEQDTRSFNPYGAPAAYFAAEAAILSAR